MPTIQIGRAEIAYELRRSATAAERRITVTPGHVEVIQKDLGHFALDRVIIRTLAQQAKRVSVFDKTRRTVRAHEEIVLTRYPEEGVRRAIVRRLRPSLVRTSNVVTSSRGANRDARKRVRSSSSLKLRSPSHESRTRS